MEEPLAAQRTTSFEVFFEDEHERLFRALCLVTRNRHEAEEIMQDAFLSMWQRWERLAAVDDLTAYLYRTAMNSFRSRVRRTQLAARKAVRLIPPDDGIARIEGQQTVVRALAPLTEKQRAAVVLTQFLDFSSEEAGEMLGLSAGAIRTLVHRARTELKRQAGES